MLVGEIERYGVSIAAIQETKWFGSDVWPVSGNFVFLHSGRPIPSDGEQAIRNEGVGILLNGEASAAWRRAGEVWSPVSSRIVTARLKWPDGVINRRKAKDIYVTVVCVYAPTAKAPPGVKAKFF